MAVEKTEETELPDCRETDERRGITDYHGHAGDPLRVPPGRSAWAPCVRRVRGSFPSEKGRQAALFCPIRESPANTGKQKAPSGASGPSPHQVGEVHRRRRPG